MIPEVVAVREIDWENHSVRSEEDSRRERRDVGERVTGNGTVGAASQEKRRKTGSVRGWRKQRDRDAAEEWQGGIERKQRHQQLPLSGRLAVIMRNKLPL